MNPVRYSLFLLVLAITACDIEKLPETQLSDQSFWKNENDIRAGANYLYTFLPVLPVTNDIWSDDAYAVAANNISDGSRLAPPTSTDFTTPYQLIRAANNVIEKAPIGLENGVEETVVQRYIAEAFFFRAWGYFQLVQKYGDVPLILKTLREDAPELSAAAAPREEVYEAIYKDLDAAVTALPTPSVLGTAGYGRISRTAALAFKARVALFEGTRAKFHQYGDPGKHLNIAIESARAVMNSKEHDLFGDYFNLFQLAGDGRQNRENILIRQYGLSQTSNVISHNSLRIYETGACNPTKALVDAYLMTDGLPVSLSPLYKAPANNVEVVANRDSRLNATIMKRGDDYTLGRFTIASLAFNRTGYCPRKFCNSADYSSAASHIDYPVIRYAEVLLIFAEAMFELNGFIADADLDLSVNLLRKRAGITALSNAFTEAHGLDMREEIRRERRVELAIEGFRYWDLIRWKTAETELPKAVLGSYFFDEFGTSVSTNLTPDNYVLVQQASARRFRTDRDYLWPFPVNELALNPALKQNPNW